MRRWLRITAVRIAIVFLLVLIIAVIVTIWPAHQAKKVIAQQETLSTQAANRLAQAQALFNHLPTLDPDIIGKPEDMKNYADQAKHTSDEFNSLIIDNPKDIQPLFGVATGGEYKIIKNVNFTIDQVRHSTTYSDVSSDITMADKLMAYHAAVSEALVNVLEYDPVADTENFSLKSADTQQRLKLAHDGLIKTDDQLQAAKKIYKDGSIDQVTAMVSGLRYKRYQLSQDGNTASWIKAVKDAQSNIMANRIKFWKNAPAALLKDMKGDQADMLKINNLWKADAAKYKVH